MASSIPSQNRAVDPFASYNSDSVNEFTKMITYGYNRIGTILSCDVSLDSTSNTQAIMRPGVVYKDNVWLDINGNHVIDFTDSDHYYNFDTGFDQAGYYYIVLEYTYVKSRPAPQAKILIVKPNQRSAYIEGHSWLFLKAVKVEGTGPFYLTDVFDYDPENIKNRRLYVATFAGSGAYLPDFNRNFHQSRIFYSIANNDFYFGYRHKWLSLSGAAASSYVANTSGFNLGELVYTRNNGTLSLATAVLPGSTADGAVTDVGTGGLVQTVGLVEGVHTEAGITVNTGDLVYLSKDEPGKISRDKSVPFSQFVGRCVEVTDSTTVNILFHRGEPAIGSALASLSTFVPQTILASGAWIPSSGLYYQDLDISSINAKNAIVTIWDSTTGFVVNPLEIEFVSNSIARIWMPVNTETLNAFIIGPPSTTIPSSNITVVNDTLLSGGSWNLSGSLYYQDVDVSSIVGQSCAVFVQDTGTQKAISPTEIEFDSTSILRIWMSVNTKELEVTAIGPTSGSTNITSLATILPSGASWTLSGSLYYQDIDISQQSGSDIVISLYDHDTNKVVIPTSIEIPDSNTVRIWMSSDSHQLNVTIIG